MSGNSLPDRRHWECQLYGNTFMISNALTHPYILNSKNSMQLAL